LDLFTAHIYLEEEGKKKFRKVEIILALKPMTLIYCSRTTCYDLIGFISTKNTYHLEQSFSDHYSAYQYAPWMIQQIGPVEKYVLWLCTRTNR